MFLDARTKWKLEKVGSVSDFKGRYPLRSKAIIGQLAFAPKEGKELHIYAKGGGLEYGPDRRVTTSPIVSILEETEDFCKFTTANSIYELTRQ